MRCRRARAALARQVACWRRPTRLLGSYRVPCLPALCCRPAASFATPVTSEVETRWLLAHESRLGALHNC